MDKENVVPVHMEYKIAVKNNDIMSFSGKWIELEKVIVNEVTREDTHYMHPLVSGHEP